MVDADANPLPWGCRFEHRGDRLQITWRWLGVGSALASAAVAIWNFYAVQMWSAPNDYVHGTPPIAFTLALSCVSVALSYMALATLINATRLAVDRSALRVSHGPLPWRGPPPIQVRELDQLFVKCSRRDLGAGVVSFSLHAMMRGGEERLLVAGLPERAQAEFLEREIERLLRIRDRPIR